MKRFHVHVSVSDLAQSIRASSTPGRCGSQTSLQIYLGEAPRPCSIPY